MRRTTRVCVVAVHGMISAATIQALEERKLEYLLGARERGTAVIHDVLLAGETSFTPLPIERHRGETQLFAKEAKVNGARYIARSNSFKGLSAMALAIFSFQQAHSKHLTAISCHKYPPLLIAVPSFTSGFVLFHAGTADVRGTATGWTAET